MSEFEQKNPLPTVDLLISQSTNADAHEAEKVDPQKFSSNEETNLPSEEKEAEDSKAS